MSHRIIISSKLKEVFTDQDVQAEAQTVLPPQQCSRLSQICADPSEPSDEDFRFMTRKLNKLYTTDD